MCVCVCVCVCVRVRACVHVCLSRRVRAQANLFVPQCAALVLIPARVCSATRVRACFVVCACVPQCDALVLMCGLLCLRACCILQRAGIIAQARSRGQESQGQDSNLWRTRAKGKGSRGQEPAGQLCHGSKKPARSRAPGRAHQVMHTRSMRSEPSQGRSSQWEQAGQRCKSQGSQICSGTGASGLDGRGPAPASPVMSSPLHSSHCLTCAVLAAALVLCTLASGRHGAMQDIPCSQQRCMGCEAHTSLGLTGREPATNKYATAGNLP